MVRSQRMVGLTHGDCVASLSSYAIEIKEILDLFNENGRVNREDVDEAQQRLSDLKSCLRRDHKSRATKKGELEMTEIERAFFHPAIHEAQVRIKVPTNSRPSRQWFDELYDAYSSIRYWLHGLGEAGE